VFGLMNSWAAISLFDVPPAASSWAEHDDAVATAWSAPGVTDVDDRITVGPSPGDARGADAA
jgi:hypothetical protein